LREPALIFFDGHCPLCCGFVRFILPRDRSGYFQYAPITGNTARELLHNPIENNPFPDSIVLYENGEFHTRSTAALRIFRKLSGAWPLLYVLVLIPAPLRNGLYNLFAKNRYRWLGRTEGCWLPKPEWKEKFKD
jgi:hypothetical protein